MSESLSQKQRRFTLMVAKFVLKCYELGYEFTYGDAFRDHRLHGAPGVKAGYGHRSSCHKLRLAVDFNLFKNGVYQPSTEAYREIGELWESMGGTWGGRFEDGNHFSLEHEGQK